MTYRMRELLSKLVNYVSTTLRTTLRRNYLRRCIKSYLSASKTLTVAEVKEAKTYWKRYTKHFSPLWHLHSYQTTHSPLCSTLSNRLSCRKTKDICNLEI